jgi:SacI homology domain
MVFLAKMPVCSFAFSVILLSLMTCHQSISTSSAFHTLSNTAAIGERRELKDEQFSGELIDVYRNNEKLVLRCRGFNQTLEFTTSGVDKSLLVEAANSATSGELDIYQSSYEGIFGVYKLPLAYCIAFIKSSEPANNFLGGNYGVRNIKEISYVVIPSAPSSVSVPGSTVSFTYQSESAKQKEAISLMQNTFSRHSFYYSSRFFDVTRNLQSNSFQHFQSSIKGGVSDDSNQSNLVRILTSLLISCCTVFSSVV